MSRSGNLRERLRVHLEREKLDDAEYRRLADLFRTPAEVPPARRRWRAPAALAAAVIFLAVIMSATLMPSVRSMDVAATRIADEVLTNHLKIHFPDVEAGSIAEVRRELDRPDFVPVDSILLAGEALEILGARYCTLQGRTATQFLLVDREGNRVTHYQAAFDRERFGRLPRLDAGETPMVLERNGVQIDIWVEADILVARVRAGRTAAGPLRVRPFEGALELALARSLQQRAFASPIT